MCVTAMLIETNQSGRTGLSAALENCDAEME
jgi:hypothetical protein